MKFISCGFGQLLEISENATFLVHVYVKVILNFMKTL